MLSICYQKVVQKVHLQTILKAAYVNRDMIELDSGFNGSPLFLWVGVDHAFQRPIISDKPDAMSMIVIKAVKILSGIRPKIILPR